MNRRIPDGTYGGVGGRGLITPSYPIGKEWQLEKGRVNLEIIGIPESRSIGVKANKYVKGGKIGKNRLE